MNKTGPLLLLFLLLLSTSGPAIAESSGLTKLQWVQTMNLTPTPGVGCWTASFPGLLWLKAQCSSYQPGPKTVGNTVDFNATSSPYSIVASSGQITSETGFTSEYDNGNNTQNPDYYTLQLNSNTFQTTVEGIGQYKAWEQFLFENEGSPHNNGYVFIQLWFFGYGRSPCPVYWLSDGYGNCYRNSPMTSFGYVSPGSLTSYILDGTVTSTTDTAKFCDTYTGTCAASSATDRLIGLYNSNAWFSTEFNILGFQDSSQAVFNSGVALNVKTDNNQPTQSCGNRGLSGETNNLNLNLGSCQVGGNSNWITFGESN